MTKPRILIALAFTVAVVAPACGGSSSYVAPGGLAAQSDEEAIASMLAHLDAIHACFAQTPAGSASTVAAPVVVPQDGAQNPRELVISPDGRFMAAVAEDVKLFNVQGDIVQTATIEQTVFGSGLSLKRVLFSEDGGLVLAYGVPVGPDSRPGPYQASVLSAATGAVVHTCTIPHDDGLSKIAAGGARGVLGMGKATLVDRTTRAHHALAVHAGNAFSPSGRTLAAVTMDFDPTSAAMQQSLTTYDATGTVLTKIKLVLRQGQSVLPLAVSDDGRAVAYLSYENGRMTIKLFTADAPEMIAVSPPSNTGGAAALTPAGDRLLFSGKSALALAEPLPEPIIQAIDSAPYLRFAGVNERVLASGVTRAQPTADMPELRPMPDGSILVGGNFSSSLRFDRATMARIAREPNEPFVPAGLAAAYDAKSGVVYATEHAGQWGQPDWQYPRIVARDSRSGDKRWEAIAYGMVTHVVYADSDVVAILQQAVADLSDADKEAYRAKGPAFVTERAGGDAAAATRLTIELSTFRISFVDPSTGQQRALLPAQSAVPWGPGQLLLHFEEADASCVQVYTTRTLAPAGNKICTAPQARPKDYSEGFFAAGLLAHPSRRVALLAATDGAVHLFQDGRLKELRKSTGTFKDAAAMVQPVFYEKQDRILLRKGDDVLTIDYAGKELARRTLKTAAGCSYLLQSDKLLACRTSGHLELYDTETLARVARWYFMQNGEWVLLGEDGAFAASPNGASHLAIRIGQETQTLAQYYEQLYRPDIVFARISGKASPSTEIVSLKAIAQKGLPPVVRWVAPQSGKPSGRDVTVQAEVEIRDGGLSRVEWRLNDAVIGNEESGRGLTLTAETIKHALRKLITLAPGPNTVEVIAYSADGAIASAPARAHFEIADGISARPGLHVLAVGIDAYRDRALQLKYAVADAQALTAALQKRAGSVFEKVTVQTLRDGDVTREGLGRAFAEAAKQVRTNDVFVFYLAGHGITLDGRYHFLPVDFRYRNEQSVRTDAVTQDDLRRWMGEISALKTLVLLDTCNSGSFAAAQMATRGLAEKTAIDKLTRATGRATIAASSESQAALEGHQGHGVFTWSLLEALDKADSDGDKLLSTSEIASFIDRSVPELTYKRWGYEQIPQVSLHGREFPIGIID